MAEFKRLENMSNFDGKGYPDWVEEWGPEVRTDTHILDEIFRMSTVGKPPEERNNFLRVVKEEFIPLNNRWREAIRSEIEQAREVCQKFNKAETGVFPVILRDFNEFMASLTTRHPSLVPMIEAENEYNPVIRSDYVLGRDHNEVKTLGSVDDDEPMVAFNYGNTLDFEALQNKSYLAVSSRLFKKATLQEQQIKVLARALEENGIQQPSEFTVIQRQLEALKQSGLEEPEQREEAGQPQDPCPDASLSALIEHSSGSEFTGVYENKSKPYVPKKKPAIMYPYDLEDLLDVMEGYHFSQMFRNAPSEKQAPGYFDVVKQHRDFATIRDNIEETAGYCPHGPFQDMRLMIDNYCHYFGKGSSQYRNALKFEKKLLKKLKGYGEGGETAKAHFEQAPRAEFNYGSEPPEENDPRSVSDNDASLQQSEADNENDNTFDEGDMDTSYAENINDQCESNYDDEDYVDDQNYGNENYGHDPEHRFNVEDEIFDNQDSYSLEGSPINESSVLHGPSEPFAGEENTIDRAFNLMDVAKQYDVDVGNATRPPVGHDTQRPGASSSAQSPSPQLSDSEPGELEDASFFDKYSYTNPESDGFAPPDEATAGEAGDDTTHAGVHPSHQPAPFAPMEAERPFIDLTSSPQGHINHPGSASAKRTHTSDDQESSDDGAPLAKRRKMGGKTPVHAGKTSLGKRSRRDDDGADQEEREHPSKRPRATSEPARKEQPSQRSRVASEPALVLAPTVPVAVQASEPDYEVRRQQIFGSLGDGLEQQQPQALQQQLLQREDSLPPSPIFEPLTPEAAAADGPGDVPAEMPEPANDGSDPQAQRDPATVPLGHADLGTITVTQLHKLPKYKKKARSMGRGTPNRPWVFPCTFGNDYGLYVLGCPTKGCDAGGDFFRRNPLCDPEAANHLDDCCGDFGGADQTNMVRKYGKQVISDNKKAVSIEWARNWNNELINEYGNYPDVAVGNDMREHNVF